MEERRDEKTMLPVSELTFCIAIHIGTIVNALTRASVEDSGGGGGREVVVVVARLVEDERVEVEELGEGGEGDGGEFVGVFEGAVLIWQGRDGSKHQLKEQRDEEVKKKKKKKKKRKKEKKKKRKKRKDMNQQFHISWS